MLLTFLSFLVVLGVLIFIHELGHFAAAKWAGIYVHRFSIGMGPVIPGLSFTRGETEYVIAALPLGGYVKMASREDEASSGMLEGGGEHAEVPPDRMFEAKPVWKRLIVILAGVTMNALFAWLVFSFLAAKNGRPVDPVTTVGSVRVETLPEGARSLAGLRPGDRITAVAGTPVTSWGEITDALTSTPADAFDIALADGRTLRVEVHADALEERIRLASSLAPFRTAVAGQVLAGRPAAQAGLQPGDTIVAVNGAPVAQWTDLLDSIETNAGRRLELVVVRAGARDTLTMIPDAEAVPDTGGGTRTVGRIGVAVATQFRSEPVRGLEALAMGWTATVDASTTIWRSIRGFATGRVSGRLLGGPIAIGQMAGQSARLGIDAFLGFMGFISINLAVLNLLPVPVLDGGQVVFLVAEGVLRRPLPLKLRERLTAVGMVLLLLLMVFAFSNDLRRVFGL